MEDNLIPMFVSVFSLAVPHIMTSGKHCMCVKEQEW
jgi:hypothetical protein